MSIIAKIIAGFVAGLILMCLLVGSVGMFVVNLGVRTTGQVLQIETNQIAGTNAEIADYVLPPDFGGAFVEQVAGFTMVSYTAQDGYSHVYLFQLPQGIQVDLDEIDRQINLFSGKSKIADRQTRIVDQFPVIIRGQQTTLIVSEENNSEGQTFRQGSAIFRGKGGQALVIFERPINSWDQAEVDSFLASIH